MVRKRITGAMAAMAAMVFFSSVEAKIAADCPGYGYVARWVGSGGLLGNVENGGLESTVMKCDEADNMNTHSKSIKVIFYFGLFLKNNNHLYPIGSTVLAYLTTKLGHLWDKC